MIISRTPFRISFAGGGSDIQSFYEKHEGCVLSASINKYMYIIIHPSFNRDITTVKYSRTENVYSVQELVHPIAKQVLLDYDLSGIELTSVADIPMGTGLASSSAYTVGTINAVSAFVGKYRSQERIAHDACEIEIEKLGEPIGKQDQYGCAIGGIKLIRFMRNGHVEVEPVIISNECLRRLSDNLLMFYTGLVHSSGEILMEQSRNISDTAKFNSLIKMTDLAYDLRKSLLDEDLDSFGRCLNEGWMLKKELANGISNGLIDKYYNIAMENGASGGKLLGAGGGGFLLFYCEEEKQKRLRAALSNLVELPFGFDYSGTSIVYVGNKDWS